jgi:hypothetical protein
LWTGKQVISTILRNVCLNEDGEPLTGLNMDGTSKVRARGFQLVSACSKPATLFLCFGHIFSATRPILDNSSHPVYNSRAAHVNTTK